MQLSDDELVLILLALKEAEVSPRLTAQLIRRVRAEMGLRVAQDFRER